jgi:serine phosphatase RsbU (regulator of sigma subunit)
MKASLLVIDDDEENRNIIESHLKNSEYQVFTASDGILGLEILTQQKIDLVLCDLILSKYISEPDPSTDDVLYRIKQSFPQLPVLVVSDTKSITLVAKALQAGADGFIVKPIVDAVILEHSIQHNLDQVILEKQNLEYQKHLESVNAELRKRLEELNSDQQAGRQVQLRMLPKPLRTKQLEISHTIKPSLILSGDFVDYFLLDDQHCGFYLADVAGHGASSAFVTVLLKNLIYRLKRNLKRGSSSDLFQPVSVLERMNQELLDTGCSKHLTIIYGVFNVTSRELNYSIGGHLPMPILYRHGKDCDKGKAEYLTGKGMPVGLFHDARYNDYTMKLPEHFTLSVFSDGVLELLSQPSLALKEKYLLNLIEQEKGNHERIIQSLSLDSEHSFQDDVALLTVVGV